MAQISTPSRNGTERSNIFANGTPPQDVEAEESLLACFMLLPEAYENCIGRIALTDFWRDDHQKIFVALSELRNNGSDVNHLTLKNELECRDWLEDVGGILAVHSLGDKLYPVSCQHYESYLKAVLNASTRRQAIWAARELIQQAHDPSTDLDVLASHANLSPIFENKAGAAVRFPLMTAADLASADLQTNYQIPYVLAKGQPCVAGAVQKGLKTSIVGIDMTISLATGTPFLGRFEVEQPGIACVLSGESGLKSLRDTAQRVCQSRSIDLADVDNWFISDAIPHLTEPADVRELRRLIIANSIETLVIDPFYLAANLSGNEAASMFDMGKLLSPLSDLSRETGVTLIIIHHFNTSATKRRAGELPELSDLSHAGLQQWCRQWLLFNRRRPYEMTGVHDLYCVAGGSAGHSRAWGITIDEGSLSDTEGRKWDVSVMSKTEADSCDAEDRDATKREQQTRLAETQHEIDRSKILAAVDKFPSGETHTVIRDTSGVRNARFAPILADLLKEKTLVSCEIRKANNKTYGGYKRSRTQSDGHQDAASYCLPDGRI